MINWMTDKSSSLLNDSSSFGNYVNSTPTIKLGRMSYATIDGSNWEQTLYGMWAKDTQKPKGVKNTNACIWTTGASDDAKMKNLYDVAGNLWEWTEETSFAGGNVYTQYRNSRGGSFANESSEFPVCFRKGDNSVATTYITVGFRVVLYMR